MFEFEYISEQASKFMHSKRKYTVTNVHNETKYKTELTNKTTMLFCHSFSLHVYHVWIVGVLCGRRRAVTGLCRTARLYCTAGCGTPDADPRAHANHPK